MTAHEPTNHFEHTPQPLSSYVSGTFRIVFTEGGTHAFRTSQRHANICLTYQRTGDPGAPEAWHSIGWTAWQPDKVGAMDWDADPWGGHPLTEKQKRRQRERGHLHGWLRSLLDYWADKPEPQFSPSAMGILCVLAEFASPNEVGERSRTIQGHTDDRSVVRLLEDWVGAYDKEDEPGEAEDSEAATEEHDAQGDDSSASTVEEDTDG